MSKTVYVLHTSMALVNVLPARIAAEIPGVRIVNVVDDALLAEVRVAGKLTPAVTRRIVAYGKVAEDAGATAIFSTCSSVGDAADVLATEVSIPVVKIDSRMAERAVELGARIGVVATVPTTLEPTKKLIAAKALAAKKEVQIESYLAEGAFDALQAGDADRHDRLLKQAVENAARECDVVVLAQASMARLVPQLEGAVTVPVLSSPSMGIAALREALNDASS